MRTHALALGLLLALLVPRPSFACASCACGDPVASRMGLPDSESDGGTLAGFAVDATRNRFATETQDDLTIAAVAGWTGARTRLFVRVPYVRHELRFLGVERRREGAADSEVTGVFELEHRGGLSAGTSTSVSLTAILPTGERTDGEMEALQPGTGAPAAMFGVSWFGHRKADRVYASIAHRMNFTRPGGYRAGDVELVNAGWQRPVPALPRVDFTVELNARRAAADRWPGWIPVADTGGDALYATPGLVVLAGSHEEWFLRGSAQIPIAQHTRGDQELGSLVSLGVFRSF